MSSLEKVAQIGIIFLLGLLVMLLIQAAFWQETITGITLEEIGLKYHPLVVIWLFIIGIIIAAMGLLVQFRYGAWRKE